MIKNYISNLIYIIIIENIFFNIIVTDQTIQYSYVLKVLLAYIFLYLQPK